MSSCSSLTDVMRYLFYYLPSFEALFSGGLPRNSMCAHVFWIFPEKAPHQGGASNFPHIMNKTWENRNSCYHHHPPLEPIVAAPSLLHKTHAHTHTHTHTHAHSFPIAPSASPWKPTALAPSLDRPQHYSWLVTWKNVSRVCVCRRLRQLRIDDWLQVEVPAGNR